MISVSYEQLGNALIESIFFFSFNKSVEHCNKSLSREKKKKVKRYLCIIIKSYFNASFVSFAHVLNDDDTRRSQVTGASTKCTYPAENS
ncbi:hypothetical protein PUN28_017158 [Cardiocondyla obscurior]|uniref:Uncharacterized protein n=1 Tax=Cardiocondyla obscurior TaxID=286306 RepID=A0AAW2EMV7_9HYME